MRGIKEGRESDEKKGGEAMMQQMMICSQYEDAGVEHTSDNRALCCFAVVM